MPKRIPLPLPLLILFLISSCDTSSISGEFKENQPPRTFLSVDRIDLPDEQRLASRVDITWWGDDPDGYVVAYEICVGENEAPDDQCHPESEEWEYTESTDTTITLPLTPGQDTDDVLFSVRAIDNEGLRDPEGANVRFPIRNSPPEIFFDPTLTPPDTTYSIMSFGWEASDPDGDEDLNYIEMTMNLDEDDPDANDWIRLDRDINFITLQINPNDIDENGNATADLYLGRGMSPADDVVNNIRLEGNNTLHVRAFDQSEAQSRTAEHEWYIKEQTSNILFINDDNTAGAPGNVAFHTAFLDQLGITYDYWDISEALIPSGNVLPTPFDPTLPLVLAQWDHIYYISNSLERNLLYALEFTSDFLAEGGSMFINIPSRGISSQNEDAVFNFLPFSGFQELPAGESRFILFPNTEIESQNASIPDLTLASGSQNTLPLVPEGDANLFYNAEFTLRGEHEISRLIAASNNDQNILFFGIDMRDITEDSPLDQTMEYFLLDHLGFETN